MTGNEMPSPPLHEPRQKRLGCRVYLLLFVLLASLVGAAVVFSAVRWQATMRESGISSMPADPGLNFAQRLYLQNYLVGHAAELRQPAGDAGEVQFEIAPGATADAIITNLIDAGLLDDPELFRNYLRYYGLDSNLQTGSFTLNGRQPIPQLAATISDALGRNVTVAFLPGMRSEEMAQLLAANMPAQVDPAEFLNLIERRQQFDISRYSFLNSLPPDASLEGFLFPDSYILPPDAGAFYLIDQMLQNFDRQVTPSMRQAYGAQGLSLAEAVTLASIVERETLTDEERPLIASVYINRVQTEMPLQADPTVQYAVGFQQANNNWWKVPLSRADLEFNHPYNTYVIPGLPPGPIANPGLSSLQAVANPADTSYLFFVVDCYADPAGRHVFSRTYEEHLAHVQKCR